MGIIYILSILTEVKSRDSRESGRMRDRENKDGQRQDKTMQNPHLVSKKSKRDKKFRCMLWHPLETKLKRLVSSRNRRVLPREKRQNSCPLGPNSLLYNLLRHDLRLH